MLTCASFELFCGGATSPSWREEWDEEKRACRRAKSFFFLIRPLRGFKYYLIGIKKDVNKNDRMLRHIAKYSYGRDGKKRRQNLQIQQMIVAEYANIFLTLNMELENRSIVIASFAGSRWRHRRINIP